MIFSHYDKLIDILEKYICLTDQMDKSLVIDFEKRTRHPWLDEIFYLTDDQLIKFDGLRDYTYISALDWKDLIEFRNTLRLELLSRSISPEIEELSGSKKKRHELSQIIHFIQNKVDNDSIILDIGGGKGHLSFSLNTHLNCECCVLDRDDKLLAYGRERALKEKKKINFFKHEIGVDTQGKYSQFDLMIGLHSCGDFAKYSLDFAIEAEVPQILHFGCCYSKMKNKLFHLNEKAAGHIELNQRSLSAATLSFNAVDPMFFEFRNQIIDFKFTFYHYLAKKFGDFEFIPMSNSRKSLYKLVIDQFFEITFDKYLPQLKCPSPKEVIGFFESKANKELLNYLKRYYALQRYIGEFIEIYILMDRAMYLQDQGYKVSIQRIFNPELSPRSIGVFASLK